MTSPLALAPAARITTTAFGHEANALLTIEEALADVELVRTIAARHAFHPIGPHYPGIRAPVSERIAQPLFAPLGGAIEESFGLPRPLRYIEGFLSIVTRSPADLRPIQRLPHFDGTEPARIAMLLYLDPGERGGTAFFRQRATRFESVSPERLAAYEAALEAGVARHGLPQARYVGADDPLFERIHQVEGELNRLIVYRGNTLHCADLTDEFLPLADPLAGRLSLNLFFS